MKKWMVGAAISGVAFLFVIFAVFYTVSVLNTETRLKNLISAKQKDNTSEYDNMWKKISQSVQVTELQKDALKDIFVEYANARTGSGGGGSLAKWVQESVPNVDTKTFENLQNIITASRDRWTLRQKEILDYGREHDNLIGVIPSSIVCSIFGRDKIDIQIVTSSRTEEAFLSGKDDDVNIK